MLARRSSWRRWVLAGWLLLGCQQPHPGPSAPAGPVRAAAARALLGFVKDAAAMLQLRQHVPEPRIEEARSAVAIHKLLDGKVDMAFTSRPLRASELSDAARSNRSLHMVVVGAEALVVIVHPTNPLRDVSTEQLREVFYSGRIADWADLTGGAKSGPIHVVAVSPKSGTGELFSSSIVSDDKQRFVPNARLVEFSDAAVPAVASDPEAISFTGSGDVTQRVRVLSLNHVAPTPKSVLDTSYALNRKLFAISDGPLSGPRRDFVRFLLSEAGQQLARESGVTPITLD